jgi:hypothetical protein
MIDELREGGLLAPEREPCLMVAGFFPGLPPTPKPVGGPVPDRRIKFAQCTPRPISQVRFVVDDAEDVV